MIHRYSHPARGSKGKTMCGKSIERMSDKIRHSDMMTTCPKCLRFVIMKREHELKLLIERIGGDE